MKRIALGVLVAGIAAGTASAQPISGLYVGAGVGGNWREAVVSGTGGGNRTDWGWGWAAVGSLGWGFGNGFRVEGEVSFRDNQVDGLMRDGQRAVSAGGTTRQIGLMTNLLYDISLGDPLGLGVPVTPYVGGGIGLGWLQGRGIGGVFPALGTRNIADASGWYFAYQAIGGVAFGLGQFVPGLSLTTEYRYYATLDAKFTGVNRETGAAPIGGFADAVPNRNHSVLVGLRYAFSAPRPAPVAAPVPVAAAPAPARTFLVFFDWDRADLTDRARQIIAEAANNARTVGSTRIEVAGHADRTGSAVYNQRLSVRRAEAVAAELVRRGVARNQITTQGFGFERPLVPTAMGVREPQNRRVEIVLR